MRDVRPTNMNRRDGFGTCGACNNGFEYMLIHNGFNDSAYGYCDRCGTTALFDGYSDSVPKGVNVGLHGPLRPEAEKFVRPCACGGHFRGSAAPRCPRCATELSAEASAEFIERHAPAAAKGWRWQRSWQGLYSIVIDNRLVRDPWTQSMAG
jgi:hypothetical protein